MASVIVEAFNKRKETTRHCMAIKDFKANEYKITCFIWIINDKNQILIKQRGGHLKNNPSLWETISGNITYEDNISSNAALRIVKEEYGMQVTKDDMEYIGCYKRTRDFVDVWLIKNNSRKKEIVMRADKTQDIAWVSPNKFEKMIQDKKAINTSYDIFKKYYKNFYSR